jgi:hypothetical protein
MIYIEQEKRMESTCFPFTTSELKGNCFIFVGLNQIMCPLKRLSDFDRPDKMSIQLGSSQLTPKAGSNEVSSTLENLIVESMRQS